MRRILIAFPLIVGIILINAVAGLAQKPLNADPEDAEYIKVLQKRATKIVDPIGIEDKGKEQRVRDLIVAQYYNLSKIHDQRDALIKAVEERHGDNEKVVDKKTKAIERKANKKLQKLHKQYISNLSKELSDKQVDQVKDGMTYGVVPLTYKGYLALLPELTDEQKAKIKEYLIQAREIAMDAGSSEKKHYWFGQYKGKINNYLSAQGYDLKEAEKRMHARQKK